MTIEKLKMESKMLSSSLVESIANLCPESLTEHVGDDGELRKAIDIEILKCALGENAAEDVKERYSLNWPGKGAALASANSSSRSALRPSVEESIHYETTVNIFIEGDNLEAMQLLRETYLGRVDMIYIDPPYNTGSDLIYKDDFSTSKEKHLSRSGQIDDSGAKLVANSQTNGRFHSDWLTMMYPRLRLARQFLADHGIIAISIDDNERANLQKICEEVFGGRNFLGCFVWKRRSGAMDAVTNLSEDHEYVLLYTKGGGVLRGVERTFEKYKNPDNDPRGSWIADNLTAGKPGGDTYYALKDPDTGREFFPPRGRYWPYSPKTMLKKISEGRVIFPKSEDGVPMLKRFASEATKPTIPVSSWIERSKSGAGQSTLISPMNSSATRGLKEIFDGKIFSFPKPIELIEALIEQCAPPDGMIMDFFAGSSTTAHAVLSRNAKDGGGRRFLLVQMPEPVDESSEAYEKGFKTVSDLSKERIRRAGKKILEGDCHAEWNRDVGFRVLKLDTSNMKDVYYRPDELKQSDLLDMVDNVKEDRTAEDLLFQVLVDWGVDLTLPIRRETVQGKTVFFVDDNALVACFDKGITEELVKELAGHQPLRVIFRDNGFVSDAVKINVQQIFRQLSPTTEVRAL